MCVLWSRVSLCSSRDGGADNREKAGRAGDCERDMVGVNLKVQGGRANELI